MGQMIFLKLPVEVQKDGDDEVFEEVPDETMEGVGSQEREEKTRANRTLRPAKLASVAVDTFMLNIQSVCHSWIGRCSVCEEDGVRAVCFRKNVFGQVTSQSFVCFLVVPHLLVYRCPQQYPKM